MVVIVIMCVLLPLPHNIHRDTRQNIGAWFWLLDARDGIQNATRAQRNEDVGHSSLFYDSWRSAADLINRLTESLLVQLWVANITMTMLVARSKIKTITRTSNHELHDHGPQGGEDFKKASTGPGAQWCPRACYEASGLIHGDINLRIDLFFLPIELV